MRLARRTCNRVAGRENADDITATGLRGACYDGNALFLTRVHMQRRRGGTGAHPQRETEYRAAAAARALTTGHPHPHVGSFDRLTRLHPTPPSRSAWTLAQRTRSRNPPAATVAPRPEGRHRGAAAPVPPTWRLQSIVSAAFSRGSLVPASGLPVTRPRPPAVA